MSRAEVYGFLVVGVAHKDRILSKNIAKLNVFLVKKDDEVGGLTYQANNDLLHLREDIRVAGKV